METYKILDQEYPVRGYVTAPQIGTVPLVSLPLMSDERWAALFQERAIEHYASAFGHAPDCVETALQWEREEIHRLEAAV